MVLAQDLLGSLLKAQDNVGAWLGSKYFGHTSPSQTLLLAANPPFFPIGCYRIIWSPLALSRNLRGDVPGLAKWKYVFHLLHDTLVEVKLSLCV